MVEYNRAPEVTKKRLFLEAQEEILSSVTKIIVDQKDSNSLLYLPLDKLINQSSVSGNRNNNPGPQSMNDLSINSVSSQTSDAISSITDRAREALRGRDREPR